jgi:lysophospholipase L1-like esterase
MEKPVRRPAACALAALVCLIVGAAPSQAASPVRYVALGDSYSAASGVLPPDPTAFAGCLRSLRNYPHLIAAATGAQLTDVTCGGADTSHFATAQYPGVAPQLDALSPTTQLVTMTIGGNDSSVFIDSILECGVAGLSTVGTGSPCKDRYGSSFTDTITTTTYPAVVRALQAVRARAPHAEVSIMGYPWIVPTSGGCFDRMPIAVGDVPYLRNIQATLNASIKKAAAQTGVTFIDLSTVSDGHDACQPLGVRWIEPVLQGTNPVIVHPNALGESQLAAQARKVLRLV